MLCFLQTSDQEVQGVHGPEENEGCGQIIDARPVTDDQEDASVSERAQQVLHSSASGRGLHETVPGSRG